MAWDFRTDPETERELEWIREMVAEIELLDLVRHADEQGAVEGGRPSR